MMALILIVDDDPVIRMLLKDFLEARHCRALEAADGVQGFEMAEKHRPHLIIMDVMMPSLHGTASTKRIHDVPALAGIPIIIYSGVAESQVAKIVQMNEITRFLAKPVNLDVLWRNINELLPKGGYLP